MFQQILVYYGGIWRIVTFISSCICVDKYAIIGCVFSIFSMLLNVNIVDSFDWY